MTIRFAFVFAAACLFGVARADDAQSIVAFDSYSPLSRSDELARRMLTPLTAQRLRAALGQSNQVPRDQAIDLSQEIFALHVPPPLANGRFALLVFVAPWNDAKIPPQWIAPLDRTSTIMVSAGKSGNDKNVLDRREPIALLAAHNVMQRYPVDASRVYIGGFSGGSRVALRLALAYPDLFSGALLEAGSDPIGDADAPIPDGARFAQFQERSRIVYLTGTNDAEHLAQDARSTHSLREWCAAGVSAMTIPWAGHKPADAAWFERALVELQAPVTPDQARLRECRANLDAELQRQISDLRALIVAQKLDEAKSTLAAIDRKFGGLATPMIAQLYQDP